MSGMQQFCPMLLINASAPVTVFLFQVAGRSSIYVGADSNIVAANAYYAGDGQGGYPQPPGGSFTASSSDPKDTATPSGPPPEVNFKTPDQSQQIGDRTLTFTYALSAGASTSLTKKVTARQFAYATNPAPSNQCALGNGTNYSITYTTYTHPDSQAVGGEISGTPVKESFNPPPPCPDTVTADGALDLNGQFVDHVVNCSNQPLTCSGTSTQVLAVAGYQVRTNTVTWSSTGVSITNNGPTQ
jgi:hypothetical protein